MLKIGIIGFGRMGRLFVEEIQKKPLWQLAYICDNNAESRQAATIAAPEAVITDNEDDIFADASVNAVGLCALADSRSAQIYKALKTGKHIIAEKPVAATIEEEWAIADAAEKSGLIVTVNLFNRNAWYHKEIINFIRSGEIGDLAIVRIAHMTPGHMPQEGHDPEGPAFHDCGMHYVDVARWYAESEYKTFHAQGVRMWSYETPWWVQAHGTFENGVVFDITQGFVYGHLAKDQTHNSYVDVIGTKGIARMTHDFKTATIELRGTTQTIIKTDDFKDKKIDVLVENFGQSILAGKNIGLPTVRDSVIASDIAWQMLHDAEKNNPPCIGKPETMNEILARRCTMTNGYGLPCKNNLTTKN